MLAQQRIVERFFRFIAYKKKNYDPNLPYDAAESYMKYDFEKFDPAFEAVLKDVLKVDHDHPIGTSVPKVWHHDIERASLFNLLGYCGFPQSRNALPIWFRQDIGIDHVHP